MRRFRTLIGAAAAAVAVVVAVPTTAHAQEFVPCSATALRNAITRANTVPGPVTLFLAFGCTYNLTAEDNPGNGLPIVTSEITVLGNRSTIRRAATAPHFRILEMTGPTADLTLNNLTISEGRSTSGGEGGGGLLNDGGELTLNSVEVTRNQSLTAGIGGGIQSHGTLILRNSTVSFNLSSNNAGGLWATGTATLSNATITGNTARDHSGGMEVNGTMAITNSRVTDNASGLSGGGIESRGATITIADTLIRGNSTGSGGGGILNLDGALTLDRTTVFANRTLGSGSQGGGITNSGATATATLRNSSVTHNRANTSPGGIFNDGGTVSLTATPVTDNLSTNCLGSAPAVAGCTN
ncbi:hypothetical protein ACFVHW_08725 [Streptomyces sp. NPDC127110]|uniref:hypothetical protein n=1 Tax=Streptomyces sp. NPDC127110 TaxID=3345362 RepID=UPI003639D552